MPITIVTAFFDIGRGQWNSRQGGNQPFLKRTTDTYFRRFSHLASLDNEMVVFTSPDLVDRVRRLRKGRPGSVIAVDFPREFSALRDRIAAIQQSPEFQARISPDQVANPEYWSAEYVLVNLLKTTFLRRAIEGGHVHHEMAAWLDFGYCRKARTLAGVVSWDHDFDPEKIHLFSIRQWTQPLPDRSPRALVRHPALQHVMAHNKVYVIGPSIVASRAQWLHLDALYQTVLGELMQNGWIDDDQSLFLVASLAEPEHFAIHEPTGWFEIFRQYASRSRRVGPVRAFLRRTRQHLASLL